MLVSLRSTEGGTRLKEIETYSTRITPSDNNNGDVLSPSLSPSSSPSLSTASAGYVQKQVILAFRKQIGNTCCGLASLAILLTAAKHDAYFAATQEDGRGDKGDGDRGGGDIAMSSPLSPYYVHEDDIYPMVAYWNNNKDNDSNLNLNLVSDEKIRRSGMTLDQITSLAGALPSTKKAISFFPSTTIATDSSSRAHLENRSTCCDDVDDDDEKGGELLIAEVDCSKESEWCIEMGYLAYPTLTYGDSSMGGIFLQQYTSLKKSYDDLLTFAKEKLVHKSFCTPGNIAACADEKRDRIRQYSDRTIHDLELLIEKEESLIDEARRKVGKRNKGLQLEYDQISKRYESETAILKRQLKLYKKLLDQALTKVQR
mmetsp:Transcript_47260/g.52833  ORF Transcript_47260/g.52833 Transcript_47260/m.52833 type:complete len:371 (-) Transcript_47260:186-1298(-)